MKNPPSDPLEFEPAGPRLRVMWLSAWCFTALFAVWLMFGVLGLVPLPSKWMIAFGEPIRTDEYDPAQADDHMTVFNLTDQVRETIQNMLYDVLRRRGPAFLRS